MWKLLYYRKQAQVFLALARLANSEAEAARYAVIASRYLEKAERGPAEPMMLPAE